MGNCAVRDILLQMYACRWNILGCTVGIKKTFFHAWAPDEVESASKPRRENSTWPQDSSKALSARTCDCFGELDSDDLCKHQAASFQHTCCLDGSNGDEGSSDACELQPPRLERVRTCDGFDDNVISDCAYEPLSPNRSTSMPMIPNHREDGI